MGAIAKGGGGSASVLTCNAADLGQTHHDLREAFGLVGVLVLRVVLAHVPVALVQLLQLAHVGQPSNICNRKRRCFGFILPGGTIQTQSRVSNGGERESDSVETRVEWRGNMLAGLPWFRKLMAFMQAYSSLLTFSWWNLRNRYINLSITSMPSSLNLGWTQGLIY